MCIRDRARAVTAEEIAAQARLLALRWGGPLALIVVDYLQLMHTPKGDSRAQRVGALAWECKQLAMDAATVVLALSQFSRAGQKAGPPALDSLKESGDIENHANVVLLLHRPEVVEYDGQGQIVWLKVAKARDGAVTVWPSPKRVGKSLYLRFIPHLLRFEPMEFENDEHREGG